MLEFLSSALNSLRIKNTYRVLAESDAVDSTVIERKNRKIISFCCNDYLGLSHHRSVKKAAIKAIKKFGLGGRASRYITGNNSLYVLLEKIIAKIKKTDDTIIFSSGYASSIGVVPALADKWDLIVADRLIHASLIDGIKISGAHFMRFKHNDIEHCAAILQKKRADYHKCLIITETVFSMDGDLGKVEELLQLADKFDCVLISDDAHGFGILPSKKNLSSERHLQIGTLSKAVGSLGGYATGHRIMIEYLRNFARSAIYSTALPPAVLAGAIEALKLAFGKKLGKKTLDNASYFCNLMKMPKPESAIVVIPIGENQKVMQVVERVAKKGFLISGIRPPTVENGKARLRITFSAQHTKVQIKKLAKILTEELAA